MPPAGEPRPERAALDRFATALEQQLDAAAGPRRIPAPRGIARLNRAEYANAVRDLLAYDARAVVDTLPTDDSIQGFDNIAAALTVSPTLIESYVNAALKISRAAVGDRSLGPTQVSYDAPGGLASGARRRAAARHARRLALHAQLSARRDLRDPRARARPRRAGGTALLRRRRASTSRSTASRSPSTTPRAHPPAHGRRATHADGRLLDERRCEGVNELYGVYAAGGGIESVEIHGPFEATGTGDTPSRRAIFGCRPPSSGDEMACAREILTRLATLAYRRPVDRATPRSRRCSASTSEAGRTAASRPASSRPSRGCSSTRASCIASRPGPKASGRRCGVSHRRLCARVALVVLPLEQHPRRRAAASRGVRHRCTSPRRSSGRSARMLADARAAALVENFAGQWLKLRELDDALPQDRGLRRQPARRLSPRDGAPVRARAARGLERARAARCALHVPGRAPRAPLRYRRRTRQLLPPRRAAGRQPARRTARPRQHPDGDVGREPDVPRRSRRVDRREPLGRRGAAAAAGRRSRPLGRSVAAGSENTAPTHGGAPLRPRVRVVPSAHRPVRLRARELRSVGRWRDTDAGEPIDATAVLTDGTAVDGPAALRKALLARSDAFVTALTERLMTYALGRILTADDRPAVRKVVAEAADGDYRFSALVLGIANSAPFRMQTNLGADTRAAMNSRSACGSRRLA